MSFQKAALLMAILGISPLGLPHAQNSNHEPTLTRIDLHRLARRVAVQVQVQNGNSGSGVWISDRYIATCEHVIHGAATDRRINIFMATDSHYNAQKRSLLITSTVGAQARIIMSDEVADIAILESDRSTREIFGHAEGFVAGVLVAAYPEIAKLSDVFPPEVGTETVLSGFPLGRRDLITQFGNVAGVTEDQSEEPAFDARRHELPRHRDLYRNLSDEQRLSIDPVLIARILVSVNSNPGNSGGPVLDERGLLVGLLEGNDIVNARNLDGTPQIVLVPQIVDGMILGEDGSSESWQDFLDQKNPAFHAKNLIPSKVNENTGISLIVPAEAISNLWRRCELANLCKR
jgi:hypothetical protein